MSSTHLIVVKHKPKTRSRFPGAWSMLANDRVATMTTSWEYWYDNLQHKDYVLEITDTDLDTMLVRTWKRI